MLSRELVLRPYQIRMRDAVRQKIKEGYRRIMLAAPTGSGKSLIGLDILKRADEKGSKSAFVVDRIVLCNQMSAHLTNYGVHHGVLQAGNSQYNPKANIQVCTAQSMRTRGSPDIKLCLIDEGHQTMKSTSEHIKKNDIITIGLSATPLKNGLSETYECIVSEVTMKELVDEGYLILPKVYIATEIDMDGVGVSGGEFEAQETEKRALRIVGDVAADWKKATLDEYGCLAKTIVFSPSINYSAELVKRFADIGANFVSISYKDSDEYKSQIISAFSKPDTDITGLIACDILTKGFDVPDVRIACSAKPFRKSLSSHIQQFGRICRTAEGKTSALWLDFSGNYLRFKEQFDDIYLNGIKELKDGVEVAKKEKTQEEKAQMMCPMCRALWQAGDTCLACGYQRPKRNQVLEVPGRMLPLGGSQESFFSKQDFWSMCQSKVESGLWDSKRAFAVYLGTFSEKPTGLSNNPQPPSEDFDRVIRDSARRYHASSRIKEGYRQRMIAEGKWK